MLTMLDIDDTDGYVNDVDADVDAADVDIDVEDWMLLVIQVV